MARTAPRRANRRSWGRLVPLVALLLVAPLAGVRGPAAAQDEGGVSTVTGSLTITNPVILANASQPYAMLLDMTAYVGRDRELVPPLQSQIIAPFEGDLATGATFALNLPIAPRGTINDVDGGEAGSGVQIYSVEFAANAFGDPFANPLEIQGWSEALSSLVVTVGASEVVGGQVVVWAPDDAQFFPTGLGLDGRFLTDDDPVGPIPAGWTLVDLNAEPFGQIRTPEAEVTIVEGDDGFTEYGQLSFTEAFDQLLTELELRYPFTELKGIDWAALRTEYRPQVEQAEANEDVVAFNVAMVEFSIEFGDGHVGASVPPEYIAATIGGRLGMRLAETETGEVIAISITEGLPADLAGIEFGAIVSSWDGRPTTEAVADEPLLFGVSTEFSHRLQQYEFLTRGPLGEQVSVTFQNPGGAEQTADLTFSEDIDGRDVAANTEASLGDYDPAQLPVDASLLPSGIGFVRVNTFYADPVLMSTAWDYALNAMLAAGATALIVDVRDNGGGLGGTPLYFAGSFYDAPFELYRTEFIDESGASIDIGGDEVVPSPVRWDLPVAVLVDDGCASACEIFAAAMAEAPDHLIVGYTPSAGVEASVYFWNLPGDVGFQASVGRLVRDGQVFLEGTGVPPTVRVPATAENLLDPGDEVLAAAEEALGPAIEAALAGAAGEGAATPAAEASPVATPGATPAADATPAA
jgi:C-terminal processing protease CtpA/Prc